MQIIIQGLQIFLFQLADFFIGKSLVFAQSDSISSTLSHVIGYEGDKFPSLPQTEYWVFICLIVLLVLLVVAVAFSSSSLVLAVKMLFQIDDRTSSFSNMAAISSSSRFLFIAFFLGVLSFLGYLYVHPQGSDFLLSKYGLFLGITTSFLLLKLLLARLLGFVFLDPSLFKIARETYLNILSLLGIALFPLLVFCIYTPFLSDNLLIIIVISFILFALLLFAFRLIQIFFSKIVDSFYILLYLCTLEILPFLALFRLYQNLV